MKSSLQLLFVAAIALGTAACSKTAETDSNTATVVDPATTANEAKADSMLAPADNAMSNAGDKMDAAADKAGDKMDAAADKAGTKMDAAGAKIDAAANKAGAQTDAALHKAGHAVDRAKDNVKAAAARQ